MMTPGSLREVQMWIAALRSTGWSSEPPLTVIVAEPGLACHTREPQVPQNMQSSVHPLSVRRDQVRTSPCCRLNALFGTRSEMPKAEADCLRHSRQWQT